MITWASSCLLRSRHSSMPDWIPNGSWSGRCGDAARKRPIEIDLPDIARLDRGARKSVSTSIDIDPRSLTKLTCGTLRATDVGTRVTLSGWVHRRRDLGGLIFIDLRDRYGLTQVVFNPEIAA